MSSNDEAIDLLFQRWSEQRLTPAEGDRLASLLRDAAMRRRWRELCACDGALAEWGREANLRQGRTRRIWPWLAGAMTTAAAILAVVVLLGRGDRDLPRLDGRSLAAGTTITGPVDLYWEDGSIAGLAADGQVQVPLDVRGLELLHGSLTVNAAHQDPEHPLVFTSPVARATIIGTRFRLRHADGATTLSVDEGRVRFSGPGGDGVVEVGDHQTALKGMPEAPTAGLRGWWPCDEGSGDQARDASGLAAPAALHGLIWEQDGDGPFLRGPGGDAWAEIPARALSGVSEGSFTLSALVRPDTIPMAGHPRDDLAVLFGRTGWTCGLHLGHDGRPFMQYFLADRSPQTATAARPVDLGQWIHLIGVVDRDRRETCLAVNGHLVATVPWTKDLPPFAYADEAPWRMAISTPQGSHARWPARAALRRIRCYDRALDEDEILRLARADHPTSP